jgi:hypothetical protein
MEYRAAMLAKKLSPSTVNVRLSAVRKLVGEAQRNGVIGAEEAANIAGVPNLSQKGTRLGNWLTRVFDKIKHLQTSRCPFVSLPETAAGRWGQGLTAEKMKECVWLKPEAVARIDFLEWTDANHLRHTKFVALRDDKEPRKVVGKPERSFENQR